jgi:PIN domain nuclease of toxin-antitoxin system
MVAVELQLLYEIGRAKVGAAAVLMALNTEMRIRICDLPFQEVAQAAIEETWTRDPFDRLIVGHAKANQAALLTKDEQIHAHYDRAMW